MEELEKLFGSAAKVKIMKLFLLNPHVAFDMNEIRKRANVTAKSARREIALLERIGFAKKETITKQKKSKSKKDNGVKKVSGWALDPTFTYLAPLKNLLVYTNAFRHKDIFKKFTRGGTIKLLIISGVLIQEWETRVDLLVVGDNLKMNSLHNGIKSLESEVGRELTYCVFSTEDFQYRLTMCDKLIRDILDYPHEKVVNKLEL